MEAGNGGGKGVGKGIVNQPLAIAALRVVLEAGEGRELADAKAQTAALKVQLAATEARAMAAEAHMQILNAAVNRQINANIRAVDELAQQRTEMAAFADRSPEEYAAFQGLKEAHPSVREMSAAFWETHNAMLRVEGILNMEDSSSEEADSDVESEEDEE